MSAVRHVRRHFNGRLSVSAYPALSSKKCANRWGGASWTGLTMTRRSSVLARIRAANAATSLDVPPVDSVNFRDWMPSQVKYVALVCFVVAPQLAS